MPAEIHKLANEILQQPKTVQIAHTTPINTVSHSVYLTERDQKTPLLMALLNQAQGNSVLIFTRTKHQAMRLAEQIKKSGFRSTSLQGNLSQAKRQYALDGFRRGHFQYFGSNRYRRSWQSMSMILHTCINFDIPEHLKLTLIA